jgi:hypothetical protein
MEREKFSEKYVLTMPVPFVVPLNERTQNEQINQTMSTQSDNGYLLIFRGNDWHKGLSPAQLQQTTDRWMAWFNGLREQGKVAGGNPLEPVGRTLSGKGGSIVSDGPFAESKEAIGGYFLLTVGTMEEAIAIGQQCPGLDHGCRVEVRPIAASCPMAAALDREENLAGAV